MALVGNLKVLFSADTAGVAKGAAEVVKSLGNISKSAEKLRKTGSKDLAKGIKDFAKGVQKATDRYKKLRAQMEARNAKLDARGKDRLGLVENLRKSHKELQRLFKDLALVRRGVRRIAVGFAKMVPSFVLRQLGRVAGVFGRIKSAVFSLKGLLVGAGIGGFIASIVKAGSDLNEQISAAGATFKGSSGLVVAAAKRQAKAFGTVKSEYLEVANGIGSIAKASGLAEPEAAKLTVQLTDLAADLASFRNLGFEESAEKIRSGLVGEAEPLRTVGVLLSAAAVEQEAYTSGLAKMGAQLTEGQKVLARSRIIMRQLADAQGDLARTANGPANQMRAIRGRVMNLAADFGRAVQPISQAILGGIGSALLKLGSFFEANSASIGEWAQKAVAEGGIVNRGIKAIGESVAWTLETLFKLGKEFVNILNIMLQGATQLPLVGGALEGAAAEFDKLNMAFQNMEPPGDAIRKFSAEVANGAAQSSKALAQQQKAMNSVGSEALSVAQDIDEFNAKIKDQVKYFGMSSGAAELAKLRDRGASPEQLRQAAGGLLQLQLKTDAKGRQETLAGQLAERAKNPFGGLNAVGSRSAYEAEVRARSPRSEDLQRRTARAGEGAVKLLAEIKAILGRSDQKPPAVAGVVRG